jgi:serine phosphatase RsbU (regulator of sigma subunit)
MTLELLRRHWRRLLAALVITAAVFVADYRTGAELSLSLLYLGPIAYAAWTVGRAAGVLVALCGVAGWLAAYFLNARFYSHPGILLWNGMMEAGVDLTVAWAVSRIKRGLNRERDLRTKLELAYRRLDREDERVGDIQRSLLPDRAPDLDGYEFAVHYATSARAGGDYYDFLPLRPHRLGLLVADASGHGSSAAVLMAITRVLVHDTDGALESPDQMLDRLNQRLRPNLGPAQFVTAAFAVLDLATGRLEVARAGHEPPLVVRASGEVVALDQGGGPPLGPFPDARFAMASARLAPGDAVLFYTDGLTEAASRDGELFGSTRLTRVLAEAAGQPADRIRDRLLSAVNDHAAGVALQDDLSFVIVRALEPLENGFTRGAQPMD